MRDSIPFKMVVYDVGCDLPFLLGPDDKMPMRSHRTPSQDAERMEAWAAIIIRSNASKSTSLRNNGSPAADQTEIVQPDRYSTPFASLIGDTFFREWSL